VKTLTALVLAGTRAGGDPLASGEGVSHKALIAIAGRAMIEHVVRALDAVPEIGRIVIAIERPGALDDLPGLRAPACRHPVSVVAAAEGPSASVASVLAREGVPLLVTTADHPLLRPEWIRHLLDAAPAGADATVALASRGSVTAAARGTRRTYLRFVEGEYSGCNLFLLLRPGATGVVDLWRQLEMDRKRPLRLMLRLGPGFALRYALGRLRLEQALAKLERASGARVAVVELADGRAAIDVDKPDDLQLVRRLMGGGAQV